MPIDGRLAGLKGALMGYVLKTDMWVIVYAVRFCLLMEYAVKKPSFSPPTIPHDLFGGFL